MWDLITDEKSIETKDLRCEIQNDDILQIKYKDNCYVDTKIAEHVIRFMSILLKNKPLPVLMNMLEMGGISLKASYLLMNYLSKNVPQPVAFVLRNQTKAVIILVLLKIKRLIQPMRYFCGMKSAKIWLKRGIVLN